MTTPRLRVDKRRTDPIPSGSILLETKLHVPVRDERLVRRPKLLNLLDAGAGRRLTLVAPPTGFGKTTLLASCVPPGGITVPWPGGRWTPATTTRHAYGPMSPRRSPESIPR